jgi:hypothetical protein
MSLVVAFTSSVYPTGTITAVARGTSRNGGRITIVTYATVGTTTSGCSVCTTDMVDLIPKWSWF